MLLDENPSCRLLKAADSGIGKLSRTPFTITSVDPNRAAARCVSRLDVPPPIPDHETVFEIDAMPFGGAQNHARARFSTIAPILVIVIADEAIVDMQAGAQMIVNRFHYSPVLAAAGDVRLIGNQN